MPYTLSDMPERIKKLPKNARKIWIKAFNSAYGQYKGNEEISNKVAWEAVKKAGYKKDNTGNWKRWD